MEDVSVDKPRPREVLVRVKATGLCHSDLHFLHRPTPLEGPTVLGHEAAGFVEAVVAAVAEFAVKRVAPSTPPVKTDPATVSAASST